MLIPVCTAAVWRLSTQALTFIRQSSFLSVSILKMRRHYFMEEKGGSRFVFVISAILEKESDA